jgi:hypothetical protein
MAQGYVTEDGTFFESKLEAELYEAEVLLRMALVGTNAALDPEKVLQIILAVMPQLRRYVDAHYAASATKRDPAEDEDGREADEGKPPEADASIGHVSSTEEDLASLLKLPTRGLGNVPDVGSGAHAKAIPKRRAKHGTGGG